MNRRITQRELRNDSGRIMRALDKGKAFIVTRNGVPVGELVPLRQRVFVPAEAVLAVFSGARAEATFEALPVDAAVARAYGRVYAAISAAGRKARGRRAMDLLIAATAIAAGLPLYTCNPDDFANLGELLDIVAV